MFSKVQINQIKQIREKKLSDFQSVSPKRSGTRWGFIGKDNNTNDTYLVKQEHGGYQTVLTNAPNDMIVLECLSATLIRMILGNTYAAETLPVQIDCNSFTFHRLDGPTSGLVTEPISYDDLSNYGLASRIFAFRDSRGKLLIYNNTDRIELSLITSLFGITDIKEEHLIKYYEDKGDYLEARTAIIDCAADFDGFEKALDKHLEGNIKICAITPKSYGIILNVFHRFIRLENDIVLAVDNYKDIKVSHCCSNSILKARLTKIIDCIKEWIPQLEDRIQFHISNSSLLLTEYECHNLINLLKSFPEQYRWQILSQNLEMFDKEPEDEQNEIMKSLPDTDRAIAQNYINEFRAKKLESTNSSTTNNYIDSLSFLNTTKKLQHSTQVNSNLNQQFTF